ncbi:CD209 antigen-like protein A [Haliotis cracherodii]|uniref:CD209 antigen-like protein A n=1 Tax=Haliotis cracherodii TaxID=6455 RepID=UPI0039ED01BD
MAESDEVHTTQPSDELDENIYLEIKRKLGLFDKLSFQQELLTIYTGNNYAKDNSHSFPAARTCLQEKDYMYFRSPMLCIKFDPRTAVWTKAKRKCEKEGARLLMLNSREKIDIVNNTCHILGFEDASWNLGGRKDSSNGQWTWVDGRRFDEADHQLWGPREPNGLDKHQQCLQTKFDVPFGLYDGRCFDARMVICERLVDEGASHNTK